MQVLPAVPGRLSLAAVTIAARFSGLRRNFVHIDV
jgi:hypothetical protein